MGRNRTKEKNIGKIRNSWSCLKICCLKYQKKIWKPSLANLNFDLMTSSKNCYRFSKGTLIFALETLCSPSTSRKIYNYGEFILSCETTLRKHLTNPRSLFQQPTLLKRRKRSWQHLYWSSKMISLHEGPRIVLSVHPVSSLNAEELENLLLKTIALTEQSGRKTVYVISDNCPLNLKIYLNLNGPGNVTVLREKISFSRIWLRV